MKPTTRDRSGARRTREPLGERRSVVVDGVRQVYRVSGAGPICFVHPGGPGADPRYLRVPELEPHLTMVYADPVGSGDSDLLPGGDYSLSRYARFTEAVLDDIGAPAAYFLGHSHGGVVGLQLGIDHPHRLNGLILYDTGPAYGEDERAAATREMASFVRRWADRPEASEAGRMWDAVNVSRTVEITDDESFGRYLNAILPAYFADYRKTMLRTPVFPMAATHDPNRLAAAWDLRDRLGWINVPALVIVGTYDFICSPRSAHELYAGLPDARLCELRNSGHFGHLEQPDEFSSAVLDFIRDQETGKSQ